MVDLPNPLPRYRTKVRTQMDTAYVGASTMTNDMLDAIVEYVWHRSNDSESVFDDLLDRFVDAIETWWDTPTLRE